MAAVRKQALSEKAAANIARALDAHLLGAPLLGVEDLARKRSGSAGVDSADNGSAEKAPQRLPPLYANKALPVLFTLEQPHKAPHGPFPRVRRTHPLLLVGNNLNEEEEHKGDGGKNVQQRDGLAASAPAHVAGRSNHHQQPRLVERNEDNVEDLGRGRGEGRNVSAEESGKGGGHGSGCRRPT